MLYELLIVNPVTPKSILQKMHASQGRTYFISNSHAEKKLPKLLKNLIDKIVIYFLLDFSINDYDLTIMTKNLLKLIHNNLT